jgi:AraC-like DNA-binding protein
MSTSGTTKFTDADDYEASVRWAKLNLVLRCEKDFQARLTWVELRNLRLLRGQENLPRVAYVSMTSGSVFVALLARDGPPPIWDGVEVQPGDIVFHSRGKRMHQRTRGPSQWGFIALASEHLAACGKALTGFNLVPPRVARILRPLRLDASRLLRLHAEACRLAETKPEMIAHREVARALEQDLIHTLVNCLANGVTHGYSARNRHRANIIGRFEDVLAEHPERHLQISELCAAIGVPERTLRMCCAEFLGMSPARYVRLRRLNAVRAALRRIDSPAANVGEIARRHGFSEPGRFAVNYRTVFGETPSTTMRSARICAP